ncbi:MAG: hypothetical protein IT436_00340 [Phycisphaerales bacterium]|nr:hypothetical protein [Phycisphaerales bacterium]
MPAHRSRTERWQECLHEVAARGGGLEFSFAQDTPAATDDGPATIRKDLVWRVRLYQVTDHELIIERPGALGQSFTLTEGAELIGAMVIGQNRWMFHTRCLGSTELPGPGGRPIPVVRLALPDRMERCQRRTFNRISTAELSIPQVECWPLLDPYSVIAAEIANRAQILDLERAQPGAAPATPSSFTMPVVGPKFKAQLLNIGGGGVGLQIERADSAALDRSRLFWLRVDLTPQIPSPLALTARLAHTHIDSTQAVYAGLAFEFGFHPAHREFVAGQLCGYFAAMQNRQRLRHSA